MTLVLCVPPNRPGVARVDIALIDSSATDQIRELTQVLAEGRGDWPGRVWSESLGGGGRCADHKA